MAKALPWIALAGAVWYFARPRPAAPPTRGGGGGGGDICAQYSANKLQELACRAGKLGVGAAWDFVGHETACQTNTKLNGACRHRSSLFTGTNAGESGIACSCWQFQNGCVPVEGSPAWHKCVPGTKSIGTRPFSRLIGTGDPDDPLIRTRDEGCGPTKDFICKVVPRAGGFTAAAGLDCSCQDSGRQLIAEGRGGGRPLAITEWS